MPRPRIAEKVVAAVEKIYGELQQESLPSQKATGEAVLRADTGSATEYTAETPFNVNTKYEWSVHAESASGIQIAYYSAFYFTPVAPTAPPPPSVPTPTPIP